MTAAMPTAAELLPLLPELVVVGSAFFLLILDLFLKPGQRWITHALAIAALLVAGCMLLAGTGGHGTVLGGMFVRDAGADLLKLVACGLSAASLGYAWSFLRERALYPGEVPVLVLFAVAGMMMLISAGNLVTVYVGLEMMALCTYALVALDRDSPLASEAAMKYFVLGSLASGLLLYGMSLTYGATGTLELAGIAQAATQAPDTSLLLAGAVFMVAGIAFKFGVAPFHMWLPDVYHGAPTPITLFIGSAPKLAAFGMAWRVLDVGIGPLGEWWQALVAILAAVSLVVGNLAALMQTNLKRMLAYSTVSHVGFLFMGLAGGGAQGMAAAMFYAITYALMATAAFGMIVLLSRRGFEADRIADFRGLNARDPWNAALVLCVMASLAGIPPFLGFWSKLAVLRAAIDGGFLWLAIVGIVCAVVGAFYYLRVIKAMYFEEADGQPASARPNLPLQVLFGTNALALLTLGLSWDPIMAWCQRAFA